VEATGEVLQSTTRQVRHASLKVRCTDLGESVALVEKCGCILAKLRWIWA
jgi:hypothetical protein